MPPPFFLHAIHPWPFPSLHIWRSSSDSASEPPGSSLFRKPGLPRSGCRLISSVKSRFFDEQAKQQGPNTAKVATTINVLADTTPWSEIASCSTVVTTEFPSGSGLGICSGKTHGCDPDVCWCLGQTSDGSSENHVLKSFAVESIRGLEQHRPRPDRQDPAKKKILRSSSDFDSAEIKAPGNLLSSIPTARHRRIWLLAFTINTNNFCSHLGHLSPNMSRLPPSFAVHRDLEANHSALAAFQTWHSATLSCLINFNFGSCTYIHIYIYINSR